MTKRENSGANSILMPADAHHFGYAIFDSDLFLCEASPSLQTWVGDCPIGIALEEILPVFAGVKPTLSNIMMATLPYWYLENVSHSQVGEGYCCFLNILVLPYRQKDGLFVTIRDVTTEETITRRVVQQRNLSWLQMTDHSSDRLGDGAELGRVEHVVGGDSAMQQYLVRELCVSTMAAVGQCLHLMRQSSTWEEFLVAKMVLASSLRVDMALAAMLPENSTTVGAHADVPHDLGALVQDVVSDFQSWIATNELDFDFSMEQVPSVVGYGSLLREVLVLLLVNGIHQGAGGGRIDLAVMNHKQGVLVKMSSGGSGQQPGINEGDIQSYWQKGDKDASVSTRTMLTRLHLVRAIAALHGGRFSLEHGGGGDMASSVRFPTGENLSRSIDSEVEIVPSSPVQQPEVAMLLDVYSRLNMMFLLTNEELVIQFTSPTLEEHLDSDLVGRVLMEAIPALAGIDQELYRIVDSQDEPWRIKGMHLVESGQNQYDVSLMPRRDGVGLILAARQIHIQASVEQILRQQRNELSLAYDKLAEQASVLRTSNDRLAGLDRERRALLNLITQDIRTSVSIISGYSERLSVELKSTASTEDQIALTVIQDSAQAMTDLVKNVMVLDRIEQKLRDITWQRLSLSGLVQDVVAMWRSRGVVRDVQIEVHTEGDLVEIEADVELLQEALQVLLERVLHPTATGADVSVHLYTWDRWNVVQFVRGAIETPPTGHQSPQKKQSRLSSTPDLQLALVRLIVEGHGGHLSVEENEGQEGVISIWLLQTPDRGGAKADTLHKNTGTGSEWLTMAGGSIRINTESQQVWLDKEIVFLTTGEYRLIVCLAENADHAVSLERLAEDIWEKSDSDAIRRLRVLVSRVRLKFQMEQREMPFLQTVRGFGYKMVS